ncbi:DUF3732 domain-containing protein [Methanoplanus sp. FWC-SCC4]|uniref:DUF3732 domain-containing protein n=1 Tax=Methanochimaera problematica TaxID=2609417 RepID=A0AA97FDK0_9EURY|nr:DUF3732 domain-containing protein [Methanoplanus sp. FWC-SCC4]WOF16293.1 DUF3732 domain-containing protein [Methanoplanus sp. FWC-SCC4]
MKTNLRYIGVVDKDNFVHAVPFFSGVNVITGRSATGKSALIEIFDYCFGSSGYTVPEGKITDCADIYFIVIEIKNDTVVLARKSNGNKIFIKNERNLALLKKINMLNLEYFNNDYFIPLSDFKKEFRKYFGENMQISNSDDSIDALELRREKKKATPTIRSFTSFILQHQNLIANKHALFYRFEEKEKRDQTIDFFKVFVGFVDQNYYTKKFELDELLREKRRLESQIPKKEDLKIKARKDIENVIDQYNAISGKKLEFNQNELELNNPQDLLDKIKESDIEINALSDEHIIIKQNSERSLAQLTADLRKLQNELDDIESTIKFNETFKNNTKNISLPKKAEINNLSECPFCHQKCASIKEEVNSLSKAINWLNLELKHSNYSINSFIEDQKRTKDQIKVIKKKISLEQEKIKSIDQQINDLENYKTQYELALKAKLKSEILLEEFIEKPYDNLESDLDSLILKIDEIQLLLSEKYNVDSKLKKAENMINKYMAEISPNLGFEKSYEPVNLKFSLNTFDLWNDKNGKKVPLRSMGSGENWLSCHITLFLALNRYFCELGDSCSIPTTLFFDQPSQVYFPSFSIDNDAQFSIDNIKQKETLKEDEELDEDILAVTNLYSEFFRYCNDTYDNTGIMPQIIVTDHADNLKINNTNDATAFNKLVQGRRWREKNSGFIQSTVNRDNS